MELNQLKELEILKLDEVVKNGTEFTGDMCWSGREGQQVYTKDMQLGGEPFTGLLYELWDNGGLSYYAYYLDGFKHGIFVEFYHSGKIESFCEMKEQQIWEWRITRHENDVVQMIRYSKFGIILTFEKYSAEGRLIEERNVPDQCDLLYVKKREERYQLDNDGRLVLRADPREELVKSYVNQISNNSYNHGVTYEDIGYLDENILIKVQEGLKHKIFCSNNVPKLKTIAGVDLAYFNIGQKEFALLLSLIMKQEN